MGHQAGNGRNGLTYDTSSPKATWPARKNVFTSAPSPQTIIPFNRLNHLLAGTSGSWSSHCASSPSYWGEISRERTRSRKRSSSAGGKLRR